MTMTAATKALVVALISVIVCPLLLLIEVVTFVLVGMGTYEDANPLPSNIASVVAVILMGAVIVALPVTAFIKGTKARNAIRSSDTFVAGASKALASQVIAGIVTAGVVIAQIYLVLLGSGVCSLDGC
jgi:hypothetical protein